MFKLGCKRAPPIAFALIGLCTALYNCTAVVRCVCLRVWMDRARIGTPTAGQRCTQNHRTTFHADVPSASLIPTSSPGETWTSFTVLPLGFLASHSLLEQPPLSKRLDPFTEISLSSATSATSAQLEQSAHVPHKSQALSSVLLGVFREDALFMTRVSDLHAQKLDVRRSLATQLRQLRGRLITDNQVDDKSNGRTDINGEIENGGHDTVFNGTAEAPTRGEDSYKIFTESRSADLSKHVSGRLETHEDSNPKTFPLPSPSLRSAIPPLLAEFYFHNEYAALFHNGFSLTPLASISSLYESLAQSNQEFNIFMKIKSEYLSNGNEHISVFPQHSSEDSQLCIAEGYNHIPRQKKTAECLHRILLPFKHADQIVSQGIKNNSFQRRTYYRSLEGPDERRAPLAPWVPDRFAGAAASFIDSGRDMRTMLPLHETTGGRVCNYDGGNNEFWVYSVPLNAQGLPRYTSSYNTLEHLSRSLHIDRNSINTKFLSTHSTRKGAPSSSFTLSTPFFQRRTNYPIRNTPIILPFNKCSCTTAHITSFQHTCATHFSKGSSFQTLPSCTKDLGTEVLCPQLISAHSSVSFFSPSVAARLRERLIIDDLSTETALELKSLLSTSRGRYFDPGDD